MDANAMRQRHTVGTFEEMPVASLHRRFSESLALIRSFTALEDHNSTLLTTISGLCERLDSLLCDESQMFGLLPLDSICDLKQNLLLKHCEQINLVRRLLQTNMYVTIFLICKPNNVY